MGRLDQGARIGAHIPDQRLILEMANLREGLLAQLDGGKLAPLGLEVPISNFSSTVDGRSVRRSKRRNESRFVTNE